VWICLKAEWKELFEEVGQPTSQGVMSCFLGEGVLAGTPVWWSGRFFWYLESKTLTFALLVLQTEEKSCSTLLWEIELVAGRYKASERTVRHFKGQSFLHSCISYTIALGITRERVWITASFCPETDSCKTSHLNVLLFLCPLKIKGMWLSFSCTLLSFTVMNGLFLAHLSLKINLFSLR